MYQQQKIAAVVLAYNVGSHIRDTINTLPEIIDSIYIVNDGSTDNTADVIKELPSQICVLNHTTNRGPGAAMATGFLAALDDDMDIVIKVDGDGQMSPEHIERLIAPIVEGKADYTKGDRLSYQGYSRTMPRFRLFGNLVLTYLTRIASGYMKVSDTQNGFVAISKRALQSIDIGTIYPYYGYLNDILTRLAILGFKVQDVPMPAKYGKERSSIKLRKFVPKVSLLLLTRFLYRIRTKYLHFPGKQSLHIYKQQSFVNEQQKSVKPLKILVKMAHPADVHLFKNFIWNMENSGHELLICAMDKDVTIELLNAYGLKYIRICAAGNNFLAKAGNWIRSEFQLWRIARKFNPDILTGAMQFDAAHVATLIRKPCIIFDDTEGAKIQRYLYAPFASVICTPSSFKHKFGNKQVRYDGCHELAYLHPNYFKPDPSVLVQLGLKENDRFVILRFVSWKAIHDIGRRGFDTATKQKLVEEISKYARVFITSEGPLLPELEKYQLTVEKEKILDLLFYATLYIGEGATMASECAVMGTPAIYLNPMKLGYLEEEEEYELVYNFTDTASAQVAIVEKAIELLKRDGLKQEWRSKNEELLRDKIDVTSFMIDFISNYPRSFYEYQRRNVFIPAIVSDQHIIEPQVKIVSQRDS